MYQSKCSSLLPTAGDGWLLGVNHLIYEVESWCSGAAQLAAYGGNQSVAANGPSGSPG